MENSNYVNRNTFNFCHQQSSKSKNKINNIRGRVGNNLVTPEIFVSEIWMREGSKSGVEIIELNSSDSETQEPLEESTYQEQAQTLSHAWSLINSNRFVEDPEYKVNNRAREKWRKNHEELAYVSDYLHNHDNQTNFNGFHYIDDSQVSGMQQAPQANCFTIINNHIINSDSSIASEQEYAVEEIESFNVDNNSNPQNTYWDHVYKDDSVSYPTNPDKRTVWIYSFKNQRRLSENDFELVDICSGDSAGTTSNSLTDEEQNNEPKAAKGSKPNRKSSPIPQTYMPRLDLSMAQTLSTVTELSELKSNESLVKKPINNWFTERDTTKTKKEVPDVVNWMSLSPRERRRRFKNTTIDVTPDSPIMKEYTHAEGNIPKKSAVIQVDAEVHATDDVVKQTADIDVCSIQSGDFVPKVKDTETYENSLNVSYADTDLEIDSENMHQEFDECVKPRINLITNKTYNVITDPIEKLNSDRWIHDVVKKSATPDSLVEPTEPRSLRTEMKNYDTCMNDDVSDSISRRLWMKRTKLMKSPLWDQYLPITDTPLSLHLSLSISSIESKKSWFTCIGKYLKCCR